MFTYTTTKFDLQLFADPTPAYLTPVQKTTDSGLSPEMKTYYDMTLIDEASAELVHAQFAQKRPIPKNGGKIIEFRKFAPLNKALKPLDEGVTPKGNSLSVSTITAEVAQYGDYITQSDVLELTSLDNTILEATKLLGKQAGLTLDTVVRNAMLEGTNKMLCPKIGADGTETKVMTRSTMDKSCVITVKALQKATAILRGQNAPTINGKYVAIVHPYVAYQLMRDPEWRSVHEYNGGSNIYNGEIGEMAGIRFVQSTEAKVFGAPVIHEGYSSFTVKATSTGTNIGIVENVKALQIETPIPVIAGGVATSIRAITTSGGHTSVVLTDNVTLEEGDIITSKGVASDGSSVFATIVVGQGAYGDTDIEGGGLQTIVKQKGSAGTGDPLDQRSSVGWKAIQTAKILIPQYMLRIESCVPDFQYTAEN